MIRLWILKLAAPIAARFPGAFYVLAEWVGALWWYVMRGLRRRIYANQLVISEGDEARARDATKRALVNLCKYYVDLATIRRQDLDTFEARHVTFSNPERLEVLQANVPLIALSAHMGNAELGVKMLLGRGREFVALVQPLRPRAYFREVSRLRSAAGGRYYEAGFAGLRACVKELQAGGIVALLGDRDIQGHGVCVEMFGRKTRLPKGPFELARQTGALIVPVFVSRRRADDMVVWIEEPMCVEPGGDAEETIRQAVQKWARLLERNLRSDPGQWTVTEDFWRVHGCG